MQAETTFLKIRDGFEVVKQYGIRVVAKAESKA
jgi:hypothetical protein